MSLDRQDIRARLDADKHERLLAICNATGTTVADFIEALVVPAVDGKVHEAILICRQLGLIPAAGINREEPRQGATGQESSLAGVRR